MAEVWFDPEADKVMRRLEADPTRKAMLAAVNRVLDQLEVDAGDASVRRMRFQVVDLWAVPLHADGEDWVILWRRHPQEPEDVVVHYIGPASFA